MKEYTKLRQFYAWVGFIVTVVVISTVLAFVINFWCHVVVTGHLPETITSLWQ